MKTQEGKRRALDALRMRRKLNQDKQPFDNGTLYAGSPMYFPCIACGTLIQVPEDYIDRPQLCRECQALKDVGWLNE